MKMYGANQQTIKEKNRSLVLQSILNKNINSRVDIARELELTKTTLTNIVGELIEDGLIEERSSTGNESSNTLGRKSIYLDLAENAPLACGILIQRKNIHVILSTLKGEIIEDGKQSYKGLLSVEEFKDILATLYEQVMAKTDKEILAIGISCIGPVNIIEGRMLNPHKFFDEKVDFDIVEFVEQISGYQVFLCNDATAGAIAEKLFGKAKQESNFIYISTYKGIGAGLYLDNKLYNGEIGQNGELGHMSINFMGPKCECGNNGCLESYADIEAIIQNYDVFNKEYPDHIIFTKENISILDLMSLAGEKDTIATAIINEYCDYLSFGIANLITQLNINLIIISGSTDTKDGFFEYALEERVNKRSFMSKYQKIKVVKSDFGLSSPLYGSVGVVIDKLFNTEIYIK